MTTMITDGHIEELAAKGYTVVHGVIPPEECDALISQYRKWLSQFKDGEWLPKSRNSLVSTCNTGHMEPTWAVRLKAKGVFAQLWKTDKLLTSCDAIAIGRPPEDGKEAFQDPQKHWLHVDQNASRVGLHAYQGAVYLEEQCIDDWTLEVLEGSHIHCLEFYEENPTAAARSEIGVYYPLRPGEDKFFYERRCQRTRVPVPKGGMVLWDSRLFHANARPLKGREHPGRWRFTVFVSMTPALWATEEDIELKKMAYECAMMTTHWSSQGVKPYQSLVPIDIKCPEKVPDIATTIEAKQLSGVEPYDFNDGRLTGLKTRPKPHVAKKPEGKKKQQETNPESGSRFKCVLV